MSLCMESVDSVGSAGSVGSFGALGTDGTNGTVSQLFSGIGRTRGGSLSMSAGQR